MDDFTRRVLINVDVEDYSSRNDVDQHEVQHALVAVLADAAARAGLDRATWDVQGVGDGELAVLPAGAPERQVVDELPGALAAALAEHNDDARPRTRLRLRVAVHQGLVRPAAGGFAGAGVVVSARMVNSAAGRRALVALPAADLVLLLSPLLYHDLVAQGHTRLSTKDFREVPVRIKKFDGTAWLHVPGQDVHALDLTEPGTDAAAPPEASAAHHTTVHGGVRARDVVFGIQNRFVR
ncbi:hypothetical protein [Saccharothrix obliqua]|uniref:hypothetical protein n=1 Tax=Saccharothrix obliqua TaxID=2861747 RepID=UPI001C5F1026|nr:hypothetical protein [Saccharothrix obliqua]MBW4719677.1 hypothetical protein [Saccharothrix obliqua]